MATGIACITKHFHTFDVENRTNLSIVGVFVTALLFAVMPFEIPQLTFALAGAVAYAFVQSLQKKPKRKQESRPPLVTLKQKNIGMKAKEMKIVSLRDSRAQAPWKKEREQPKQIQRELRPMGSTLPDVRKPSAVPIQAPTFRSADWEMQVTELLNNITPTVADDKVVAKLATIAKQAIEPLIDCEVVGFASGDLTRNKAFGVAVPEVDLIAKIHPESLAQRLRGRLGHAGNGFGKMDARKLQKSGLRACTDKLVSSGGFKFRRSAFRGSEPKVTLLAPASFGLCKDAIPIDFSVNAVTPLHNAALFTECGQLEPRARSLILLVKRWAKDRGICHAAKGHLSPYAWSLLSMFFLQTGIEGGSLLPPVEEFETASQLMTGNDVARSNDVRVKKEKWTAPECLQTKTVGELFKEFMHFYHASFDWKAEAISVRVGKRNQPGLSLPLHIILHDDGKTEVGPSIEDPFDRAQNLGEILHAASVARLREEFARADTMCSAGFSLDALLEPWMPPEQDKEAEVNKEDDMSL